MMWYARCQLEKMFKCERCNKEFDSKNALDMHNLAKHMNKEERKEIKSLRVKSKKNKKIFMYLVIGILFLGVAYGGYSLFSNSYKESYTKGVVHWHATISVFTCGEEIDMPTPFGDDHIGSPLLHTHSDKLIHVEGKVWKKEDITLGKYFEVIGLKFTDEQILNYKNGDLCGDGPGEVKLWVNEEENFELSNYVIKDDDEYKLRFE